jgi:hypothetical protein
MALTQCSAANELAPPDESHPRFEELAADVETVVGGHRRGAQTDQTHAGSGGSPVAVVIVMETVGVAA